MRNTELLTAIYKRLPKMGEHPYSLSQVFDRCMDIQDLIERERPEVAIQALESEQELREYKERQEFFNDTK